MINVDQISNLIAKQYNAELGENLELANLQAQLKEIDKQIESLITAIMNGLNSKSIELKIKQLENEKSILTEKMVLSESHQTKPIKPDLFSCAYEIPPIHLFFNQLLEQWIN